MFGLLGFYWQLISFCRNHGNPLQQVTSSWGRSVAVHVCDVVLLLSQRLSRHRIGRIMHHKSRIGNTACCRQLQQCVVYILNHLCSGDVLQPWFADLAGKGSLSALALCGVGCIWALAEKLQQGFEGHLQTLTSRGESVCHLQHVCIWLLIE